MTATDPALGTIVLDPGAGGVRSVNRTLHEATGGAFTVHNPQGAHALAAGLDAPLAVTVEGHVGYYCAGMNKHASVTVHGNAGPGLAENIMSGTVRITGNASQSAGATGHGGLVVIEGNASARCGISMKGVTIVVGGNVGHMSAFMAQAGDLIVLGDAGADLGDSIYEARLFVRGSVASLGADCIRKDMRPEHHELLARALAAAGFDANPDRLHPLRLGPPPLQLQRRRRGRARHRLLLSPCHSRKPRTIHSTEPSWHLRESHTFDRNTIAEIRRAANTGVYRIRGWGAKRVLPTFDDLVFLGASMSRYPLEGYREACATNVVLGRALRLRAHRTGHPHHHRRHELRVAVGQRQGGARPGRQRRGHVHHHRRRWHDRRGAHPLARRSCTSTCRRAMA